MSQTWKTFVQKEWILILSALGVLSTSFYLRRLPSYTISDAEILYILFVLLVITNGLQQHAVLEKIARRLEQGRFIPTKLMLATFFFSMLVTNDVALLAVVPLTMLLNIERKDWLVIFEILAANAGSAISPFGNPQNLFLYWFYQIPFGDFLPEIAPFSLTFLLLLAMATFLINSDKQIQTIRPPRKLPTAAYFYIGALVIFALAILRILPIAVGAVILFFTLLADRKSLRVDYALLLTFACFFGFSDNLRVLLASALTSPHHVFLLAALLSQIISNVPTALLLADFTNRWQPLLWGVSVGGFGSLMGSLANLIGYRIYVQQHRRQALRFTVKFHLASYSAFLVGLSLYFFMYIG